MQHGNAIGHVCVSVCPVHALTFEILDLETPFLGRVALGVQRPIVVKLSRERSVGQSVGRSVFRSVQCIVEKRQVESICR